MVINHGFLLRGLILISFFGIDIKSILKKLNIGIQELLLIWEKFLILDLCGDPSEDRFAIKGLVLGDVQSGKTANYTAICNKAADTGYRIIIILAGMQENLRKQTQERLDAECTGRKSEYYLDPKAEQGIKKTRR